MKDYMTALLERFGTPSAETKELQHKAKAAEDKLRQQLGKRNRRLLLRLVDAMDAYQFETELDAFTAGFRLADGIHRELDALGAFSAYEKEG